MQDPTTIATVAGTIGMLSLAGLSIADHATGTAFYQRSDPANWDLALTDPSTVELADIEPVDVDGWDDIPEDVDAYGTEDDELESGLPWLHSLLYSDYQDPSDDDDRADVDIPRYITDAL
jgi:hypothetical protein